MKTIRLGKTGLKASRFGINGIPITRSPKDEAVKAMQSALDREVNFADTSVGYEDSEERIGKMLVVRRGHVTISAKVWTAGKATTLRR